MLKTTPARIPLALGALSLVSLGFAQSGPPALSAIPALPSQAKAGQLSITREAVQSHPFSVIGPKGAVLGQQDGSYEVWLFPWKVIANMHIEAQMQDYAVPIDVNAQAAEVTVRPDATTITFSHANFTVREVILAPKQAAEGEGALVLYEIEAIRPMTLTFSFTPVMQRMWPAESDDRPSPEWVKTAGGSGFYMLHLNFPDHAAAIAMPTAGPGILEPYQERAQEYPLQFVLHFDPKRDAHTAFPLLFTMGNTDATATKEALASQLADLDKNVAGIDEANRKYYENFRTQHMSIDTPDERLNQAFAWAEVSIDQLRVQTTPNHEEEALTAGFVGSGDAARPGFGWFFGRDALWSLYAVNSYGGFDTTKQEIAFLLKRQSPEGKIMHEWSQTANLVDWKSTPYEYASSDATPLLPMAMNDYLNITGDKAFIAANWDGLARAWHFMCVNDSDGDGIYDNSQGSGWVESWIPKMPHQEIYLAALDEQASLAFAKLAEATNHAELARQATARAANIRATIEKEYYQPQQKFYAFSYNAQEGVDTTPTIFPAVAWWDGSYALDHNDAMMKRWASAEFSTDWGTRILSDKVSFYDPISYHQGTVWPLFTGWVSVAEYRSGHALAGWTHLEQNANLTWFQDLGDVTELLSGQYFQVLGRSTAHQLWSSAMVISPVVRGLFGLEWNAAAHELTVTPQLPAMWDGAVLKNIPFGNGRVDLTTRREGDALMITASGNAQVKLRSRAAGAKVNGNTMRIPLAAVEAGVDEKLPLTGAVTAQIKVLDEETTTRGLTLHLEAAAGSTQTIYLRVNDALLRQNHSALRAAGVVLGDRAAAVEKLTVEFPSTGADQRGYVEKDVSFQW